MAKYFLGSVGKAEAFKRDADGNLTLAFVSKTLTDSGLNISTTKDDIRAGQGAPIQFSFYHDPSVEITLTDVLWKPEYLEAQLGASFDSADHVDYKTKEVDFTNGVGTLNDVAMALPVACDADNAIMVWGAKKGTDEWVAITATASTDQKTTQLTLADTTVNATYCVRYLGAEAKAQVAEITSTIIPEELFLVITAPIFAGDACAASKGKTAGHITFEVPRFQLNGSQEFSMNMSSNQTMSLAGIAVASESADCDAVGGKLLRIIEVIENRDELANVEELVADEATTKKGSEPQVYGVVDGTKLIKIDNAKITFTPALVDDKIETAGEYTMKLTNYTAEGKFTATE